MRGFSDELKRRRVYQSAAIYAVAAWGLAQVIDFVSERLFLPDWIPTLTAIVFVVGFPIAIFLSWTFDIRGDGVHRTDASSIRGIASLSIAFAMLIGGTALIYSIVWPRHDSSESVLIEAPPNSIAVLPFTTLGDVASSEYLSEGIAEEILYALSTLQDLRVAARTSSFSFKGKGLDIAEVSRALNVRNVLEEWALQQVQNVRDFAFRQLIPTPTACICKVAFFGTNGALKIFRLQSRSSRRR